MYMQSCTTCCIFLIRFNSSGKFIAPKIPCQSKIQEILTKNNQI